MELSKLILNSPKCSRIFQLCKQELSPESTGLHPLCPTTWTIQTKALNYLLGNYSALTQALQQISEESHDDYGRRANAILSQLQRFDTFFGIKLPYLVFSATEQTSINLPKRYLCTISSEVEMNHLKRMRNDESFRQFYTLTVEEAKDCIEEPLLPRYRRPPKKIDDGEMPHSFKSAEDMIKMHYFYAMDLIWQEINDRFDQKSLLLPKEIESLLLRASSNQDTTRIVVPESIKSIYLLDIDVQKLEIQLQMLPDLLRAYKIYNCSEPNNHKSFFSY